jgi:hypothetical protein
MIDTRKSIVLPGHAQLEAAVLRDALLRDVELGHDLDARDDRAVELLGDRPHGGLQHPVNPVLHMDRVVLCLDVDVTRPALQGGEDRRIHQLDDRADVARQPLDRQVVVAVVVFLQELQVKALGGLLQHALRALALLQDRLDRRRRTHRDLDRRCEQSREFVDHRQIGRVRHHDDQRPALATVRHEAVTQHQVRGNRPEQIVVDQEVVHVDELEPVPLGEPSCMRDFGEAVFGRGEIQPTVGRAAARRRRRFSVHHVSPVCPGAGISVTR